MTDLCNKRDSQGPGLTRCIEPRGHDSGPKKSLHRDDQGNTWGKVGGGGGLQPGGALKQRSDKQKGNLEVWAFIKRCFMACHPFCVDCGRTADDEWLLDLDHTETREWTPENAALRCRNRFDSTKGCHPAKTGVPMFSKGASS